MTNAALEAKHARHLFHEMVRIRRFEERCVELYSAEAIRGFLHLYIGEEAVAVGVNEALGPDDAVVATYREHGQALARGLPAKALYAEMLGKVEGCSRGRGGSMHLFDVSRRFYGGNAIVAGGLPLAVGLALADQLQGRARVTACFFGDGAVAEGEFHESMNLAALWHLPVLFCCENNQYAMGTALERAQSQTDLALKAASYGVPSWAVDGMDVVAVERAARAAAEAVRSGGGPYFLELRTYRFRAHSMYDPDRYRDKAEIEAWRARDPIAALRRRIEGEGLLPPGELDAVEDGKPTWTGALNEFYSKFKKDLQVAEREMVDLKGEGIPTEVKCEKCGKPMVIRMGRSGQFLACTGYPECKNTSDLPPDLAAKYGTPSTAPEVPEQTCEKCGKPMALKRGRFGYFMACTGYPECRNTKKIVVKEGAATAVGDVPLDEKCPEYGNNRVKKHGRYGEFVACSN